MKRTTPGGPRRVRLSPTDVLALGLVGIRSRKARAALSALGISIGIATMFLVTAIPMSSQAALLTKLTALGTNILRVDPLEASDSPVRLPDEAVGIARRIGPVESAAMVANTHQPVRRSDRSDPDAVSDITVLATSPELLTVTNGTLAAGRFIGRTTQAFPDVVLGYVAASRLGINAINSTRPQRIFIGATWFTVVGVLRPMPLEPDLERAVFIGWGIAVRDLGFDGHPTVVYVKANEESLDGVRDVLAASLYPQSPGLLMVSRPSDALAAKQETQSNFSNLFIGLAAVSLLVGGVGVANTMLISVLERRREIGLRRALGARRSQIRGQFLTESALLSLLGGTAGVLIGATSTATYVFYQGWPLVMPLNVLALGVLSALAIGVLAGIYPAIRASRLSPTEALSTS